MTTVAVYQRDRASLDLVRIWAGQVDEVEMQHHDSDVLVRPGVRTRYAVLTVKTTADMGITAAVTNAHQPQWIVYGETFVRVRSVRIYGGPGTERLVIEARQDINTSLIDGRRVKLVEPSPPAELHTGWWHEQLERVA